MQIWGAFFQDVVPNYSTVCLSVLPSIRPVNQTVIVRVSVCPYTELQHRFFLTASDILQDRVNAESEREQASERASRSQKDHGRDGRGGAQAEKERD